MNIVKNKSVVYEGEGLYMTGGNYIYKGIKVDNYVKYSNMLWRIIKINTDNIFLHIFLSLLFRIII